MEPFFKLSCGLSEGCHLSLSAEKSDRKGATFVEGDSSRNESGRGMSFIATRKG